VKSRKTAAPSGRLAAPLSGRQTGYKPFVPFVPWRPRARPTLEEPVTSSSLVGEVLARLGGEGRLREFRVFEAFHEAVGAVFRTRTQPESLHGQTLFVRATSGSVAHELVLLRAEILAKINAQLGHEMVGDLRTKIGPLPSLAGSATDGPAPRLR